MRGVDLAIAEQELVTLVGPSGCGKTTLLRLIAGLEEPDRGHIRIGGHDVTRLPPKNRDIAMVFQNHALYPHMTVFQNMAFGLKARRIPRAEIKRGVAAAATTLGIEGLLDRKPAELSGGERQRVAVGRAIVRLPRAFLLDEPLCNPRCEASRADESGDQEPSARTGYCDALRYARPGGGHGAW